MKAVNLLPSDMRKAAVKVTARVRPERAEGIGAYVLLGALALCVTAFAAYVLTNNTVKQRTADLDQVTVKAAASAQQAAALKPYADFEALATARVETVRGLAAARFDWEQALRDLSRAVPAEVKLQQMTGDMGLPGTDGASGGDPLRGSIAAPAITLTGCAPTQPAVASMMARLRAVDGVTRVSLSKSAKEASAPTTAGSEGDQPCGGKQPPSFSTVVFFEGSAALDSFATDSAAAAPSSGVPVPNAVAGAAPAADQANATADASADATGGESTTTSGSTP